VRGAALNSSVKRREALRQRIRCRSANREITTGSGDKVQSVKAAVQVLLYTRAMVADSVGCWCRLQGLGTVSKDRPAILQRIAGVGTW